MNLCSTRSNASHRLVATIGLGLLVSMLAACGRDDGPPTQGSPVVMRRLTEEQYRQSIADIFGPDIKVAGRFEPSVRKDGLIAVGTSAATITPGGFEQYEQKAQSIAAQVTDADHRTRLIPCAPAVPTEPDEACATKVIAKYGRLLFRRPLADATLRQRVADAAVTATANKDFYSGIKYALGALLYAPEFLFGSSPPSLIRIARMSSNSTAFP